ncbi:MAG: MFS transporter [Corynebacteriales bacterium]|nr:MFS transporter [Mycobacteriales bacterium]
MVVLSRRRVTHSAAGDAGKSPRAASKSLPRQAPFLSTVILLCLGALLTSGQLYATIPLTHLLAEEFDASTSAITFSATMFGFAYAIGFVAFGPLSDRFGRRHVILGSIIGISLSTAAVAAATDVTSLVSLRTVQGLFAGAFGPAAMAYLGERMSPERRTVAMASLITSFAASSVVVQLAAQEVVRVTSWRAVFIGGGVLGALLFLTLARILVPGFHGDRRPPSLKRSYGSMFRLFKDKVLIAWFVASAGVLSGFVTVYTALPLSGIASEGQVTALRIIALPAFVAVPLLAGKLSGTHPAWRGTWGLTVAAVVLALTAIFGSVFWLLVVLIPVLVLSISFASSSLAQAAGDRASHARASATAVYSAMIFVGASIGSAIAGSFASESFALAVGLSTIVVVVAALAAACGARWIKSEA